MKRPKPILINLDDFSEDIMTPDELEYEQRLALPDKPPPGYPTVKRKKKKRNASE